jgi:hypothetical protein
MMKKANPRSRNPKGIHSDLQNRFAFSKAASLAGTMQKKPHAKIAKAAKNI